MTESVFEIFGREHELEVLTTAVDAAAEAGRALAVCGEPEQELLPASAKAGTGMTTTCATRRCRWGTSG